jgi:hypothetical protein
MGQIPVPWPIQYILYSWADASRYARQLSDGNFNEINNGNKNYAEFNYDVMTGKMNFPERNNPRIEGYVDKFLRDPHWMDYKLVWQVAKLVDVAGSIWTEPARRSYTSGISFEPLKPIE